MRTRDLGREIKGCDHEPIHVSSSPDDAAAQLEAIKSDSLYLRRNHLAWLGRNDLFFLLVHLLQRKHFIRDERTARWTFSRCREVEAAPDGFVDLWPRESFKSEIITFGKTIQDLLNDPEKTFGFFSHTRPLAANFLYVIKHEFEINQELRDVYPDVLWQSPRLECLEHGVPWTQHAITLKRKGNRKEASIEAWGLTDGQPTGRRFTDIVYDDVVARKNITPLMIDTTTRELENSFLLTASDPPRYRYIGTFQEIGDTTQAVIDRGIFNLRRHGPLDESGQPAYCTDDKFADLRKKLGTKVFALQILLDPAKSKVESDLGFKDEWLEYYDNAPPRRMMNVYGLVDPAGDSLESNSEFALWILGYCSDKRRRVLDIVLDKFDLEECWQAIFERQQKWECLKWGYEKYGMQRDIEHYKYRMRELHYTFPIIPLGGIRRSKDQRIGELIPSFRDHQIIFPRKLLYHRKDGREIDLVKYFREREYSLWPYNPRQRDLLDALARSEDREMGIVCPKGYGATGWKSDDGYAGSAEGTGAGSFMSE